MRTPKNPKNPQTAKPRRSQTQKNISSVSARSDARRSEAKTTQKTDRSGVSARNAAPQHSEAKIQTKNNNIVSAKKEAPRRTGTKLTRLLAVAPAKIPAAASAAQSRSAGTSSLTHWLLYCRPGFEKDCAQEAVACARAQRPVLAEQPNIVADSGYAIVVINEQLLSYRELIFTRQLIRLHRTIDTLPERDRLTPILAALPPGNFGALWLEVPDTNDGKTLSAFIRRFQPLLEDALREQGRLLDDMNDSVHPSTGSGRTEKLQRLHIFFPDKASALIGTSDPYNSSASIMGIHRQSMPAEAPSRSTLKLAEAIDVFLDKSEQTRLLRSGMTAVDLGAAPGGWTWQMVKRGIRVTAVDNGDMKGAMAKHPLVEHMKQDGFKFAPRRAVDWMICDMVEKPAKVAELVGNWFVSGWCKHAIFNLKLPMKQRVSALDSALGGIRSRLDMEGISYKMIAKQLYHDREEITVFLTKTRNR